MNQMIVPYYGIHWDEKGVAFLMQGRGGTNALGLKEKAPFKVQLPNRQKHCNHQIPLAAPVPNDRHWDLFTQLLDDELVRAMLPIPKQEGGVFFVEDDDDNLAQVLVMLSKLSSPIYNVVMPAWMIRKENVIQELQATNVQPFVITQLEAKNSTLLSDLSKAAVYAPRKLICSGKSDVVVPQQVKRIKTELNSGKFDLLDLMALPWENLGATVIRKWMRNEWPPRRGSYDGKSQYTGRKAGQT